MDIEEECDRPATPIQSLYVSPRAELVADAEPSNSPIIPLGPIRSGKTTLAQRLSVDLVLPCRSLDERREMRHLLCVFDANRLILTHDSDYELAKFIHANHGKPPEDSSADVIQMVGGYPTSARRDE